MGPWLPLNLCPASRGQQADAGSFCGVRVLVSLDEAIPSQGVRPVPWEPGCPALSNQPGCALQILFRDFLISLPGRRPPVKSLAPALRDMGLSVPRDSPAGSWVSLSPQGSRHPGGKDTGRAGVRSSVTITLSLRETQTYEWPLFWSGAGCWSSPRGTLRRQFAVQPRNKSFSSPAPAGLEPPHWRLFNVLIC